MAFGAADDYINDSSLIPVDEVRRGKSPVMILTSEYGTHANHLTGNFLPKSWYQYPCAEFLYFMEDKLSGRKMQKTKTN